MEKRSALYGFYEDCWRNGTVLTAEMKIAVKDKRITQSEYDQITVMERGDAYPDQE
ncbi:XkdX family protein [Bacillus atrophaeus]|uniref:XkdX family protein n=1 Tax=Bacillus atrophaeus TaxID=1452 RepID=UPI000A422555|nr:XkdX family protein [Bacillus atrophaeus]MCY8507681.1 XkdX family protein [Bacillus atrophaeus]MCY8969602.1 XkdX family protein [Bacillus atrophaeus]MED1122817.1 XkdX family protein [Bacillus atrophaeus]MED4809521.1 XkdX family protein [Bacillus atrophaeus]PRS02383.1 XkdX family protein [Bacillus atrophaeus]